MGSRDIEWICETCYRRYYDPEYDAKLKKAEYNQMYRQKKRAEKEASRDLEMEAAIKKWEEIL